MSEHTHNKSHTHSHPQAHSHTHHACCSACAASNLCPANENILTKNAKKEQAFLIISGAALLAQLILKPELPYGAELSWIAIALLGLPIVKGGISGLIFEREIKEDFLVASAIIAAVITKEYFAAGEIAFLMTLGEILEGRTVAKARKGIESLVKLTPVTARRVTEAGEEIIRAEEVEIGDTIRVLAGENIATDGIITKGTSSVDQSVLTGEPIPVDKNPGDEVFSGTINRFGTFEMKSTKKAEDSSIARMIKLVKSADAGKTKIYKTADKIATYVVILAFTLAIGTWLVTGEVLRAVTILVVFCPCALTLATPTAIMAAIGNVAKKAFLVKEGDALERLAATDIVALDKTGTITKAEIKVEKVTSTCEISNETLYSLTATAEANSEHPIGKAITAGYRKAGNKTSEAESFELKPGRGIKAKVEGKLLIAGNLEMLAENGIKATPTEETKESLSEGKTVIWVALDGKQAGYLILSDTIKEGITETITSLKELGIKTLMLTGDSKASAKHAAQLTGIDEYVAECTPEAKLEKINELRASGHKVCMIGDGVNDAASLAAANTGIAMAKIGSGITIEAADIAQIKDEIKHLPHLIRISVKMMRTIKLNIILSLALNFIAIGLAMTGWLTPLWGALVHNAGVVAVILNSSTLLKTKAKA